MIKLIQFVVGAIICSVGGGIMFLTIKGASLFSGALVSENPALNMAIGAVMFAVGILLMCFIGSRFKIVKFNEFNEEDF